jgi:hypothetical protein
LNLERPADVSPVFDSDDHNGRVIFVNRVDDAVGSAAGRPIAGEVSNQGFSYPSRLFDERPGEELHHRGGYRLGEALK